MHDNETGGPAFPVVEYTKPEGGGAHMMTIIGGMTLRQYAAIQLKVPDSGTDWLDVMLTQSLRDDFAAKVLQGICASNPSIEFSNQRIASEAYQLADAMIEARKS